MKQSLSPGHRGVPNMDPCPAYDEGSYDAAFGFRHPCCRPARRIVSKFPLPELGISCQPKLLVHKLCDSMLVLTSARFDRTNPVQWHHVLPSGSRTI